jgi:hypothetical protein
MSTQIPFELSSIVYDNIDSTVLVNAISRHDHLSHETQLFVTFSELNRLISDLQRSNPEAPLSELFMEEKIDTSYTQYTFQGECLENRTIYIDSKHLLSVRKEIRA